MAVVQYRVEEQILKCLIFQNMFKLRGMMKRGSFSVLVGIISNITMWTITTLKGFRIGARMQEISGCWKLTLGLKHPVHQIGSILEFLVLKLTFVNYSKSQIGTCHRSVRYSSQVIGSQSL